MLTTRPLLCIVTDRRRLAAATGSPLGDGCELVLRQVEAAVASGVPLLQIRERDLESGDLFRLAAKAVEIAGGSATQILVNDRVDIALAAGTVGVHLREAGVFAADVRRIAPQLVVGRSVHAATTAAAAGPVDYFIAGTVFATKAKPEATTIGLDGLREIVRAAEGRPVLAIGGIQSDTARHAATVGAAGVAAIGAFMPEHQSEDIALAVHRAAEALRRAFEMPASSA